MGEFHNESDFDLRCDNIRHRISDTLGNARALNRYHLEGQTPPQDHLEIMMEILSKDIDILNRCKSELSEMEYSHGMCNDDLEQEINDALGNTEITLYRVEDSQC